MPLLESEPPAVAGGWTLILINFREPGINRPLLQAVLTYVIA